MRWSQALIPTTKEDPVQARLLSHKLMLRGGMIHQLASGVYSSLPLAARVLRKISAVIREEMDGIGGQEVILPILQPLQLWQQSGRVEQYGPLLFRMHDRKEAEFCLGATHEEVAASLLRDCLHSYRQLPLLVYQIQTKFRDEIRPRFGLMRAREFLMKDGYSFCLDAPQTQKIYQRVRAAYERVFARCGLKVVVVEADSGDMGGSSSHEFQVPTQAGEDILVHCTACGCGVNQEVLGEPASSQDEGSHRQALPTACPRCRQSTVTRQRGIEVGHIFDLGTKYANAAGAVVQDGHGRQVPLHMASYGIGVSRVAAAIMEQSAAAARMHWPMSVAPFHVALIAVGHTDRVKQATDDLYAALRREGTEVLYDDRPERLGLKLKDADLVGCPLRVCIGERGLQQGVIELQEGREFSSQETVPLQSAVAHIAGRVRAKQAGAPIKCRTQ